MDWLSARRLQPSKLFRDRDYVIRLGGLIFTIYRDLYQSPLHNEAKALHTLRIPEQDESFLAAYFEAPCALLSVYLS